MRRRSKKDKKADSITLAILTKAGFQIFLKRFNSSIIFMTGTKKYLVIAVFSPPPKKPIKVGDVSIRGTKLFEIHEKQFDDDAIKYKGADLVDSQENYTILEKGPISFLVLVGLNCFALEIHP